MNKLKMKKGDKVLVTTGKDKGKTGEIIKVMPKDLKILVSGINLAKKHTKVSMNNAGGIITKEMPIHISNVSYIDPKNGGPTRIGYKIVDNKKVRFAKKSGEIIG